MVEWVREGGLHLQWRDRAGFDRLPCYAQLGTEGTIQFSDYRCFNHRAAELSSGRGGQG